MNVQHQLLKLVVFNSRAYSIDNEGYLSSKAHLRLLNSLKKYHSTGKITKKLEEDKSY